MKFDYETLKRHETEGISVRALAKELGTHPNSVRRAMIKAGIKISSRSDSMKKGYENGNIKKRMGYKLSEEHRIILSEANYGRKRVGQKRNTLMTDDVTRMSSKAANKNREAAQKGSKFERMLIDSLTELGYNVEHQLKLDNYKIDLFMPDYSLAIEIDGIAHREPIYGVDKLEQSKEKDRIKEERMRLAGYSTLHVEDNQKAPSHFNKRKVTDKVIQICQMIKNGHRVHETISIN